jgi:cystathionine beta-lyase
MADPLSELTLEQLRLRASAKWRQYPDDVLPMWVAEMDVPLAPAVAEAIGRAVELGDTGYPSGSGYAEALSGFAGDRWSWIFDPEHATVVPDLMTGVEDVLRVITEPGDGVVINPPVYPPFFSAVENTGRRLHECPLGEDGRLDLEALAAAFAESANRAFILCNPHNPTGAVHTAQELSALAGLAAEHGVRVVADEIHGPLVYSEASFVPYLSLPQAEDAFAVHSSSKAWNLAGVKAALVVAGPESLRDLVAVRERSHSASHVGVIAHTVALNDARDWLDDLVAGLERNRDRLGELLDEQLPWIGHRRPEGTYLAWLDCRELRSKHDPAALFLEHGRVALNPGPTFGTAGTGFARLNFACPPDLLEDGVARIARAVAAIS